MSRKRQNNGPATVQFDAKVRELVQSGWGRQAAVLNVANRNPGLHRAMLCETNAGTTDAKVLAAVASGAESIAAPVQRSTSGQAKQTSSKPLAGTAAPKPVTQATSAPAAPVAPIAPAAAATSVPVKSSAVAAYEANEALLDAALAKRHARGLYQCDAVLDLLASDEANLWHESIRLYRMTLPPDPRIAV